MKRSNFYLIFSLSFVLVMHLPNIAFSADPLNTFTFQGQLSNADGSPIISTLNMTFKLYDNQSNCLWTESKAVSIIAGGFDLMLGKTESNPIPFTVNEQARYIGLAVGGDPEMEPRQEIGGVLRAGMALSVTDASISTSKIVDSAITTEKIASNAVSTEKLSGPGNSALSNGTSGQVLTSNGDGTFKWDSVDTNLATTNSNITLSSEDQGVLLVSGNTTVSLPAASSAQGKLFTIKKTDSSDVVTIIGLIDGLNNLLLNNQYDYISVISDGSNWYKIAGSNLTPSTPGEISGTRDVNDSSQETYSVSAVASATEYVWTVPSGASILSGAGTNSILVSFSGASSGDICVVARNTNGDSGARCTTAIFTSNTSSSTGFSTDWVAQTGTNSQFTKCDSVTDNGYTCINPEIRYGTVTGGIPHDHSDNNYNTWCTQLGFSSWSGTVNFGNRGTQNGKLFWCSSYDETNPHWCDWSDGAWYNQTLNNSCDSNAIINITCQ